MVKNLIVSSIESYSGKSGFIAAFGKILKEYGFKVGYFKPFGLYTGKIGNLPVDEDALMTAKSLNCQNDFKLICPVLIGKPYIEFLLKDYVLRSEEIKKKVIDAYEKISRKKDVVLIEGTLNYISGKMMELCDASIAKMFNSFILMIVKYSNDFIFDKILLAKSVLGDRLRFLVFNQVALHKREMVLELSQKILQDKMEILGALPLDPVLKGVFISEMVETLNGKFLVKPEQDQVIEELLIGAMSTQSAMTYFRGSRNSVLIVAGDRPELQILALESPNIKCLILTRNIEPPKPILGKAESLKKPIILVRDDTASTIERIHELFGKIRIKGEKVQKMKELIEKYVEVNKLLKFMELTI